MASTQGPAPPKTTPLLEALKAEKSAARDKEAILRNHAHYKQADLSGRKEEKKRTILAAPSKGSEGPSNKKAAKKAQAQAQAQVQAVAAAAVQAAAKPTQKGSSSNTAASPSKPPKVAKPPRSTQPGKAGLATAPPDTTTSASTATARTDGEAPRRTRPVIGLGSRNFEAALNIAGLANSATERRKREKEKESIPTPTEGATTTAGSSLNIPSARIDASDTEQEKDAQGPKIQGPSPRKERPRRGRGGGPPSAGPAGGGGHASESVPSVKVGVLQRNDGSSTRAATQKPAATSGVEESSTASGGGPPRGRRGRGGGRGRGAPRGGS